MDQYDRRRGGFVADLEQGQEELVAEPNLTN